MTDHVLNDQHQTFWRQYKDRLVQSFRTMTREEQERLLRRGTIVSAVGISLTLMNILYGMLPPWVRILLVPVLAVGSYHLGKRVLAPFVIKKMDRHLSQ